MTTSILKPGILVSLSTSLRGGVLYERVDLDAPHADGSESVSIAKWETTRRIDDPVEHERATKVRGRATTVIRSVCSATAFGLLCPESREDELDNAIREARSLVDAFNVGAQSCRVHVYVMKGRVASTDEEAAKGIAAEVEGLLADMQNGIRSLDVKSIREAANRAKQIGAVLESDQATKVGMAVELARSAARQIVKRVEKEGEEAQRVLADVSGSVAAIETARIAFLDLDSGPVDMGEALPAVNARDLEV